MNRCTWNKYKGVFDLELDDIKRKQKNTKKIVFVVLADIIGVGIGLYLYCLFQFILPREYNTTPIILPTPTKNYSPIVTADPGETPGKADEGDFGAKFPDRFTSGEVIKTDDSYISKDINIKIEKTHKEIDRKVVTYYVADIYIRNLENFKTFMANGKFGIGQRDSTVDMAKQNDAIVAISGDYYAARREGIVIRNGKLYRDELFQDVLIMYNDGSMKTYTADEFDINHILQNGAYQGWSFGPMLLEDGKPMEKFNSNVTPRNPRASIGYYEPGHYCFVLVDGRQPGYSEGLSMKQLSQLFYDLGCKVAYNLDGGQTAVMAFMGEMVNQPYNGGRDVSDIIYIAEK